jgi:glucokinase
VENLHDALLSQGLNSNYLRSIGVSCGGPLDPVTGIIQSPPNLPGWDRVPIRALLQNEFGVDCFLENDANAGALAEHRFGAGRGVDNLIFLTMGTGLGAGLILNGRLYRGASYSAGEIGHIRLTQSGPDGYHKAGAAEGWASGGGMAKVAALAIDNALQKGERTVLTDFREDGMMTARAIWRAAQSGDALAREVIVTCGEKLGEAIAILVDVLNPECVVVGGLALHMGDALLGPARALVNREALASASNACRIVPAALGEQIGDVAALCIATQIREEGPFS